MCIYVDMHTLGVYLEWLLLVDKEVPNDLGRKQCHDFCFRASLFGGREGSALNFQAENLKTHLSMVCIITIYHPASIT